MKAINGLKAIMPKCIYIKINDMNVNWNGMNSLYLYIYIYNNGYITMMWNQKLDSWIYIHLDKHKQLNYTC